MTAPAPLSSDAAASKARPPATRNSRRGNGRGKAQPAERKVHPLLEKLAALYPQLFGARFLPLQRGVYEELLARHPDELPADELKVALGLHARSGRYLEAIASRLPRHGLDGQVVEPVAPEHVHHAIVELYRRRQARAPQEDLRPKLLARLVEAIEASGLDRVAYTEQVRVSRPEALALLDEAFAEHGRRVAKREALRRAFEASGQPTLEAFADMYGMDLNETRRLLGPDRKAAAG
ncbi:MAG: ProQ/FINO family protein [Xenophilus sp.]